MMQKQTTNFSDASGYFKEETSIIPQNKSDYWTEKYVLNLKTGYLPDCFYLRKALYLNNLGDIEKSYLYLYNVIVHHEEDLQKPSKILLEYFTIVYDHLKKQNSDKNKIKWEMFGSMKNEKQCEKIFERCQTLAKMREKGGKTFYKEIRNQVFSIQTYLQKSKYSKDKMIEYEKFIMRNLKYILIKSKEKKKAFLSERVKCLRPLFYFTLLEDKKEEQLILLENENSDFFRFDYQKNENLILKKYINTEDSDNIIISLEDLILSLGAMKKIQAEILQNIKKQLQKKLCKHISWELYLFLQKTGEEYPELNPITILFNIEKEYFFLSSEPVIVRYLLGYKNRPATKEYFFQIQRFKKIERMFKSSEEIKREDDKNQKFPTKNFTLYRLMKAISCLERLEIAWMKPELFLNRRLDNSASCRDVYGEYVYEIMKQFFEESEKEETIEECEIQSEEEGPSLKSFVRILYKDLCKSSKNRQRNSQTLQILYWKAWLKVKVLKLLLNNCLQETKEKGENTHMQKASSMKIIFYTCLFAQGKYQELMEIDSDKEKRKAYEEYVKLMKRISLEKNLERGMGFTFQSDEQNKSLDQLKPKLNEFINYEIQSERNDKVMKNYQVLNSSQLKIHLNKPQQYLDFYELGKVFIDGFFTPWQKVLYKMIEKMSGRNLEEAIINVYQRLKENLKIEQKQLEEIDENLKI